MKDKEMENISIKIVSYKECKTLISEEIIKNQIINLWNAEYGFIFPLDEELLKRSSFATKGIDEEATCFAIQGDEIIGFILAKTWHDTFKIDDYDKTGWINLIFVKPSFREKGIGSELLNYTEDAFHNKKIKTVYLGKDLYNYFPGLPMDMKSSVVWWQKRKYEVLYSTNDLIKTNLSLIPLREYKNEETYVIRFATNYDFNKIKEFLTSNWPGRWTLEFLEYVAYGGTGREYLICLDKNECICGFCKVGDQYTNWQLTSYNQTWRNRFKALGGIGPLGVDKNYRHRNIAYNLLATANNYLIDQNVSEIIIDWTNLMDLYRRFGFEIWKSYYYIKKEDI